MVAKSPAPKGLKPAGAGLWREVSSKYVLRSDERVVLEKACRAVDRITAMEAELGDSVTETGSMGQVVVHPLIAEVRAHEAQVAKLLGSLKLPDEPAEGAQPESRSTQARAAAQSRWGIAHGAGA